MTGSNAEILQALADEYRASLAAVDVKVECEGSWTEPEPDGLPVSMALAAEAVPSTVDKPVLAAEVSAAPARARGSRAR